MPDCLFEVILGGAEYERSPCLASKVGGVCFGKDPVALEAATEPRAVGPLTRPEWRR